MTLGKAGKQCWMTFRGTRHGFQLQTLPIWLIAICLERHVPTDGVQSTRRDVISLANPGVIQSNRGFLRSTFTAAVEGP